MEKPIQPLPTDCCGGGCRRCIYDIYAEQLEKYQEWKSRQEETSPEKSDKHS